MKFHNFIIISDCHKEENKQQSKICLFKKILNKYFIV